VPVAAASLRAASRHGWKCKIGHGKPFFSRGLWVCSRTHGSKEGPDDRAR
jgi:hypothetical protein